MPDVTYYKHRSLRYPDAIRLCRVLPNSDIASSMRICLSSYRLSDPNLNFTALSYTWGDPSDKVSISIGGFGAFLQVPRSSVEALTVLRLHGKGQLYWIDAICINQDDLREKNSQVRMMGRIFATASCTTIYLGQHSESSRIVFQELIEALQSPKVRFGHMAGLPDRDAPNITVIEGLEELIQRPWFRRVWVLQEAHLGRNIQVLCGDSMVPKVILIQCFFGYRRHLVMKMTVPFAFTTDLMWPESDGNLWYRLWRCLFLTRNSLATDPRDRLFALKALFEAAEHDFKESFMADFDKMINYEKSLEQVFETFALAFLRFIGLRLLVGARHGHDRQMPSWVPDWSQNLPLQGGFFLEADDSERHLQSVNRATSTYHQLLDSRILRVQGWRCGQINEMGETYSFANFEDAYRQISRLLNFITIERSHRTIQKETSKVIEVGLSHSIMKVFREMEIVDIARLLNRDWNPGYAIEDLNDIHETAEGHRYLESALQSCRIVLCGPSYIAVAPRSAMKGDVLVVVEGARSPCLIRPSLEGTWNVVSGDCYALSLDPSMPLGEEDVALRGCGEETWETLRENLGEAETFHLI